MKPVQVLSIELHYCLLQADIPQLPLLIADEQTPKRKRDVVESQEQAEIPGLLASISSQARNADSGNI
jgi:hypothetical protein